MRDWRRTEGKSDREIRRCLKRHLVRRIFKLLQRVDSLKKHPRTLAQGGHDHPIAWAPAHAPDLALQSLRLIWRSRACA